MSKIKFYENFEDVLIKPTYSEINSRQDIELSVDMDLNIRDISKWKPIPIMSANMDTVTDANFAFELVKHNWIAVLHKFVEKSEIKDLFNKIDIENDLREKEGLEKISYKNVFVTRGSTEVDKQKLIERLEFEPRIESICIDVANGHRQDVLDLIKYISTNYPDKVIMGGNVGTSDVMLKYIEAGAHILKAGIGPGSVCITRIQTGVGVPQIGLMLELSKKLKKLKKKNPDNVAIQKFKICLDGGMKVTGDLAKSYVAGADFVMLGGMLAGHKESPGELKEFKEGKKKEISGMASEKSQQKGVPSYGVEEGKTVYISYKGKLKNTIMNTEGGLRSAATYINSISLHKFRDNACFVRTNIQENKIFN